jgi:hypothetical protein
MPQNSQSLYTKRTLIAAVALLVLFTAIMFWMGRPAWCKYGLGVLTGAWTQCTSQHLADPYTLSHILHGIIFYWLLVPVAAKLDLPLRMLAAIVLEIGWELVENSPWVIERYRQHTASLDYIGDSVLNSFADVVATVIGFAFASRFSWKASVGLFIVFELWMLYAARDNLTLNIVMLFFPIESIKQWQLGGM